MRKSRRLDPLPPSFGSPLVVWAHSFCRSTLATYLELRRQYPGIVRIIVCGSVNPELRARAGFVATEFPLADFEALDPSPVEALLLLNKYSDAIHMFCAYHGSDIFKSLLDAALRLNLTYFIASEAPQNMEQTNIRQLLKEIYIPTLLKKKVQKYVRASQFVLSYSGSAMDRLTQVGWPKDKVEEFGYYTPSLFEALGNRNASARGGSLTKDNQFQGPVRFLLTGTHCVHKSPRTLVEATSLLVAQGLRTRFKCIITGVGKQTESMKSRVQKNDLPVEFLGFVSLETLIGLYLEADVFVATGASEPWGIRVNDALNLGCPAIVSDGMGSIALINEIGSGWTYRAGSACELAEKMKTLIERPEEIAQAKGVLDHNEAILPAKKAAKIVKILQRRFPS